MIILRGGTLVTDRAFTGDLGIEGEKIALIADTIPAKPHDEIVDCTGCYVFPGGIDPHTHFAMTNARTTTADDYESGTKAALAGGTTTIINFATPVAGEPDALHRAFERETEKAQNACCDYAFHMEILDDTDAILKEIQAMTELGVCSYKAYLAYAFRLSDDQIYRVMKAVKQAGGVLSAHCENGDLIQALTDELDQRKTLTPADHPSTRPAAVEAEAIHRFATIGRLCDYPIHVVHLSAKEGLDAIRYERAQGAVISAETCPQYLLLDQSLYENGFEGAKYICSPPLRTQTDREALLAAIEEGDIQTLATDHCSYRFDTQKSAGKDDYRKIPGGLPGVQFRFSLAFTHLLKTGRVTPEAFAELTATHAARLYGLYPKKGVLKEGSDADLVVYDPEGERILTKEEQIEAVDYTPYEGQTIQGSVRDVWLRGQRAIRNGNRVETPHGQYVFARKETEGGISA